MKKMGLKIYTIILLIFPMALSAQTACDTLKFLQCEKNHITIKLGNKGLNNLIEKFNNTGKNQKINIVHIGDSHLQAGFLSEKVRQTLFQNYLSSNAIVSPGLIFPYTMAQTNNPYYYNVDYTGNWEVYKSVDSEKTTKLGLMGISVHTAGLGESVKIRLKNKENSDRKNYYFNAVKILHNTDSLIKMTINGKSALNEGMYSSYRFDHFSDSLYINMTEKDTSKDFELYGILLENNKPGISYHTVGLNGATARSYLKCDLFSDHLSLLKPDLVIISLGTNEAHESEMLKLENKFILKDLIYQIQDVAPDVLIILTTLNDHLKNKRQSNPNIEYVRENTVSVSNELGLGIWDFYKIMGGAKSIQKWYKMGLTGEDKLHFNKKGYELQAELFSAALMNLISSKNKIGVQKTLSQDTE